MKRLAVTAFTLCLLAVTLQMFGEQQASTGKKTSQKAQKQELEAGAKLYDKYACKSCHGAEGVAQGDLRQAFKKYTDDQMKAYIKNPRAYNNTKMPVFNEVIPDADYKALIAYVKWLGQKADATAKKK